jgi:hypothetical protein
MSETPRRISMTVTFLEMTAKPSTLPPPLPKGKIAFLRAEHPPTHFYRYLYDTIGEKYFWVDRKKLSPDALAELLNDPRMEIYVLYADGNPAGLAELDLRAGNSAYIGRRLGYFFLYHACMNAWLHPITKLKVNTCTLDHPRALPLYQRLGFAPVSREERYLEMP